MKVKGAAESAGGCKMEGQRSCVAEEEEKVMSSKKRHCSVTERQSHHRMMKASLNPRLLLSIIWSSAIRRGLVD
jgi:hypothetical protein